MAVGFTVLLGWRDSCFGTLIFDEQLLDALGRPDLVVYLWYPSRHVPLGDVPTFYLIGAVRKKAFTK